MFNVYEFHWKARDRFQRLQRGKTLAENRSVLENRLLQQGFSQIRISRNFVLPRSPNTEVVTQFLTQLSLLLKSHIPLKNALNMLLENCTQISLYLPLKRVINDLESGYAFSQALSHQANLLPPQAIQLIKMGESSGQLSLILSNLAENRAKSEKLAKKVKKILFYPLLILTISLSLSLLLLIFIVPKFAELYANKGQSLPFITQILFDCANILQQHGLFLGMSIPFLILGLVLLYQKTAWLRLLKWHLLSVLPVLGEIIRYNRTVFFCQNTALMLNAQLRLDTILDVFISQHQHDPILANELRFALKLLNQGYRLNEGLTPHLFNNEVIQMIAIAERSGHLAEMLEHISEMYQQKLDYQVDIMAQLLEPVLMLIMGMIVGIIMLGLYLPIFDMGNIIE